MFVDSLARGAAQLVPDRLGAIDAPMRVTQLRVLAGAISRRPANATAFAHRESRIMVNVASFYETEQTRPVRQAWMDGLAAALEQEDHGAYVKLPQR